MTKIIRWARNIAMTIVLVPIVVPIALITVLVERLTDRERLRVINQRREDAGEEPYTDLMDFYRERAAEMERREISRAPLP